MDWGWATINYNNTSPVHSGSKSVAVTIVTNTWQAIYIAHGSFNSSPYSSLTFWINGGASGGQQLQVVGHAGNAVQLSTNLAALAANTWQQYSIPLAALGLANRADVDGIWIQDGIGAVQPTFYLDDIYLTTNSVAPPAVTLTSPANGSSYAAPASIPLAANVVSNGHTITKVQFYSGSTLAERRHQPALQLHLDQRGHRQLQPLCPRHLRRRRQRGLVGRQCDGHRHQPGLHHGGCPAQPPPHQPADLRRSLRADRRHRGGPEHAPAPLGRQRRNPLQLGDQRPQSRRRLVLRKHRRLARHPRRGRRQFRRHQQERRRRARR